MTSPLEFRVPIAPSPAFYSNIRLAAMSLAKLGAPYTSAPLIVSVGYNADLEEIAAANPWAEGYPVVWHAVPPSLWGRGGFEHGLFGDRFPKTVESDVVIHCDADTCVVDRLDSLLAALASERPTVAGCMAHYSPFGGSPDDDRRDWLQVFEVCGLPCPPLEHPYSLIKPELSGLAPHYFNAGFVAMNREAWNRLVPAVDRYTPTLRAFLRPRGREQFAVQTAMAIAMAEQDVDVLQLGLEHNCPNDDLVFDFGILDPDRIKVIHYLRTNEIDRHNFFLDEAAINRFLSADLAGPVNNKLKEHVRSLRWTRP